MTTFPLTESLGLKIHTMTHFEDKFIKASDLEAVLEKGVNIQPIQRKVEFERCFTTYHAIVREEDFSRFKGKKVKVTIEEVP